MIAAPSEGEDKVVDPECLVLTDVRGDLLWMALHWEPIRA